MVLVTEMTSAPTQRASSTTHPSRSSPMVSKLFIRSAISILVPVPSSFCMTKKSPKSRAPANPPSSSKGVPIIPLREANVFLAFA